MTLGWFGFEGVDLALFVVALIGTGLFVIKLVLMLIGLDSEAGFDFDGLDDAAEAFDIGEVDDGFHLLSFQGIMAFLMMFGWVGLALRREADWPPLAAFAGAFAAGVATMWLFALAMVQMRKLQHSGNVDMKNAIGKQGEVYLTIKPNDTGKVQITLQGALRIYSAITESDAPIATGERVKVINITGGNVLVVEKI